VFLVCRIIVCIQRTVNHDNNEKYNDRTCIDKRIKVEQELSAQLTKVLATKRHGSSRLKLNKRR